MLFFSSMEIVETGAALTRTTFLLQSSTESTRSSDFQVNNRVNGQLQVPVLGSQEGYRGMTVDCAPQAKDGVSLEIEESAESSVRRPSSVPRRMSMFNCYEGGPGQDVFSGEGRGMSEHQHSPSQSGACSQSVPSLRMMAYPVSSTTDVALDCHPLASGLIPQLPLLLTRSLLQSPKYPPAALFDVPPISSYSASRGARHERMCPSAQLINMCGGDPHGRGGKRESEQQDGHWKRDSYSHESAWSPNTSGRLCVGNQKMQSAARTRMLVFGPGSAMEMTPGGGVALCCETLE